MTSFTVRFAERIVVGDFLQAKGISEAELPRKTLEPIHTIQFADGVAQIITEKRAIVYRVPQAYIQAYRFAQVTHAERIRQAALDAILLHILRTPSNIQMQLFIPKEGLDAVRLEEVKRHLHRTLSQRLNNPNTEICDFIEFDSFDDATQRTIVAVTNSRPLPETPFVLTSAVLAALYAELLSQKKATKNGLPLL